MPTKLAIDDKLIEQARRIGQHKTKKEAVTAALSEYIAHRKRLKILNRRFRSGLRLQSGASKEAIVQVLVDTNICSLALRRPNAQISEAEKALAAILHDLIQDGRARLIGPIRQELLSGIREPRQYQRLRTYLRAFPDELAVTGDYEQAARRSNQCRSHGISGSGIDFLICSIALSRGWQILTTDADFRAYARAIPIQLYASPGQ